MFSCGNGYGGSRIEEASGVGVLDGLSVGLSDGSFLVGIDVGAMFLCGGGSFIYIF